MCLCALLKGQQREISLLEFLIIYGTVRYRMVPGTQYGAQISRLKGLNFFSRVHEVIQIFKDSTL
jgi:hypothetical protein